MPKPRVPTTGLSWDPRTETWGTAVEEDLFCSARWEPYLGTLPTSGMTRGGQLFELPTPVPLTGEHECSSTPSRLEDQVGRLLPTPNASDGMGGPGHQGRSGGLNLRTAVVQLSIGESTD